MNATLTPIDLKAAAAQARLQAANDLRAKVAALLIKDDDARFDTSGMGQQRAALKRQNACGYNSALFAAMDLLEVAGRDSDLFRCNGCGEHFTSQELRPRCTASYSHLRSASSPYLTRETENVPEDTTYCGTCLLGCESVDESGCCEDCAKAFREASR
jgi:hypothetical protein